MSDLCLLETVSLPYEAEHLQQVLGDGGVEAFVEGLHGSNAFGMNSLMGRIRIKVREGDLPRARELLSEMRNRGGSPWFCGPCQEVNEGSFDYCWKCGGERSVVATDPPLAEIDNSKVSIDFSSPHAKDTQFNPSPYAPPESEPAVPVEVKTSASMQVEYEDRIERAYKASVLGLITVPILLHLYSLAILMSCASLNAVSTARTRWRVRSTLVINLTVLSISGILITAFMLFELLR